MKEKTFSHNLLTYLQWLGKYALGMLMNWEVQGGALNSADWGLPSRSRRWLLQPQFPHTSNRTPSSKESVKPQKVHVYKMDLSQEELKIRQSSFHSWTQSSFVYGEKKTRWAGGVARLPSPSLMGHQHFSWHWQRRKTQLNTRHDISDTASLPIQGTNFMCFQ